ncbi:hypothetical protein Tco_1037693 [Tanacetum coccineum]
MTNTVVNNSLFRSLFEKQKFTGNNFMEWYRNLRIVLCTEDKLPLLEQPIHVLPVPPQGQANPPDVIAMHQAWVKAQKEIVGLMLMIMDPEIQKTLEHLGAYDMLNEPKSLYVQQVDHELLQTVQEFYARKQEEGQFVSSYILKMKSYIDNLDRLGHAMTQNLSVSLILVSLRREYNSFVQNYNMHSMGKKFNELHAMSHLLLPNLAVLQHPKRTIQQRTRYATNVGLRRIRKLMPGALSLYVGDGHRAAVEAISDYHLCLPRYPKETIGYSFYYPPKNKIFVAWNAEFLENSLINHKASGSLDDHEIIQDEDTRPSLYTSLNHVEDEHELGDLDEPANYKAASLDPKSNKWLNAMNVEMQSMK